MPACATRLGWNVWVADLDWNVAGTCPMARQEADREDLMRDAKALRERAAFRVAGFAEPVVAGYRAGGSLSIYFGPDPCYHFDPQFRLRRAFIGDHLYRTQGDTLARLTRQRGESQTILQRHDLTSAEVTTLRLNVIEQLTTFLAGLNDAAECLQTVPTNADLRPRLIASLRSIIADQLPLAPAVRGKR